MAVQLDHIAHSSNRKKFPLSVLAHNLKSPYNVGGLFRLADALGIDTLYLSGNTPHPPNRKISKTSRSTDKLIAFESIEKPLELLKDLKKRGVRIIALEICDNSTLLEELTLKVDEEICLILGEENFGVNEELLAVSDEICHIDMYGQNSSMNVISACAIACHSLINKLKK